jgi:homoserine/homoserine lactone efflux protein
MSIESLAAFVAATAILVALPGPTVMLIAATSVRGGKRAGLTTVAGSSAAILLQLTVVVAGLASVVTLIGQSFEWLRLAGVLYLAYLGVKTWRARPPDAAEGSDRLVLALSRGFFVSLTNPKTLLFLGAFFPQFIDPSSPAFEQLVVLSIAFWCITTVLDSGWALFADWIGARCRVGRPAKLVSRLSAVLLLGASAALALTRRT